MQYLLTEEEYRELRQRPDMADVATSARYLRFGVSGMTLTNPTDEDLKSLVIIFVKGKSLPHYMAIACRYLYIALVNGGMSSDDAMGVLADYVAECNRPTRKDEFDGIRTN